MVDLEWPPTLKKAMIKLWDMYETKKGGRVRDSVEHLEEKFEFSDERKRLQVELRNVQAELKKAMKEKLVTLALKAKAEHALIEVRA